MKVVVQHEDFDLGREVAALYQNHPGIGAVASFLGLVRGEGITSMTLEHYPGMTEKSLNAIVNEAVGRWAIVDATLIHRVGCLYPTEPIVLVAVASSHRGDAFAACEFIMDALKTRAPFWKKEITPDGEHWVDARASDVQAAARWSR